MRGAWTPPPHFLLGREPSRRTLSRDNFMRVNYKTIWLRSWILFCCCSSNHGNHGLHSWFRVRVQLTRLTVMDVGWLWLLSIIFHLFWKSQSSIPKKSPLISVHVSFMVLAQFLSKFRTYDPNPATWHISPHLYPATIRFNPIWSLKSDCWYFYWSFQGGNNHSSWPVSTRLYL